jgi:hypothetical protein
MDVNLHDTTDAQIWTEEWLKTIKRHPEIPTDRGTMIGWFANAIMAGYDAGIANAIMAGYDAGKYEKCKKYHPMKENP